MRKRQNCDTVPGGTWVGAFTMSLRRILAAASYVLYAIAAIIAVHAGPASWQAEYDVSIPTAISNVVYGVPLGFIDSNVQAEFRDTFRTEGVTPDTVNKAVEVAARGEIPRGTLIDTPDGTGIGQTLFSVGAMRLFGPHLLSLPYAFLLLMGLSTLAFIGRYSDSRLVFVPLQFTALSIMLLTPLFADPSIRDQAAIGGNRFFGILGILPALHVFFEFADTGDPTNRPSSSNWLLMGLQLFIFVLAVLVRSSGAYMVMPLVCAAIFSVRHFRDNQLQRITRYRKFGNAAILAIMFAVLLIACAPSYVKAGRIGGLFWHRAFVSFVLHPDWPFGNLRDVYPCTKYIPEGLSRENGGDRNGHCVWWVYPPNQSRPVSEVMAKTYGSEYETALRRATFYVISAYPRQALELYFYYKPLLIASTLWGALDWQLARVPFSIAALAIIQGILFICFVAVGALKTPIHATTIFVTLGLFLLFSLAPQEVAWASPWTSADLIWYMYAAFAAGAALLVQAVARRLRRSPGPGAIAVASSQHAGLTVG